MKIKKIFQALILLGIFILPLIGHSQEKSNTGGFTQTKVVRIPLPVPSELKTILDKYFDVYHIELAQQTVKLQERVTQKLLGFDSETPTSKEKWETIKEFSYHLISLVIPPSVSEPNDLVQKIDNMKQFNIALGNDVLEIIKPKDYFGFQEKPKLELSNSQIDELKRALSQVKVGIDEKSLLNALKKSKVRLLDEHITDLKETLARIKPRIEESSIIRAVEKSKVQLKDGQVTRLEQALSQVKPVLDKSDFSQAMENVPWEQILSQWSPNDALAEMIRKQIEAALQQLENRDLSLAEASLDTLEKEMIAAYELGDYTRALDVAAAALRRSSNPEKEEKLLTRFGTLYLKLGAIYWQKAGKLNQGNDRLQASVKDISGFVDTITQ